MYIYDAMCVYVFVGFSADIIRTWHILILSIKIAEPNDKDINDMWLHMQYPQIEIENEREIECISSCNEFKCFLDHIR